MNNLQKLLEGISYQVQGALPENISMLALNSVKVKRGGLFFAIRGAIEDGHRYIGNAIQAGASAVVVEEFQPEVNVPQILVSDTKIALSKIADAFFDSPSGKMQVVGVTGTNGKTTTVFLLNHIFKQAGLKRGTIGTLGYTIEDESFTTNLTTPDSLQLQSILFQMVEKSVTHVAMEVSSHSLALHRVDDIRYHAGVFTNISQDHLDFHHTIESYAKTKTELFRQVEPNGFLVCNADDPYAELFHQAANARVYDFSLRHKTDFSFREGVTFAQGIDGIIDTPNGSVSIRCPLSGEFNLKNILGATAVASLLGIPSSDISEAFSQITYVPGRLQEVSKPGFPRTFVDYAHTPDAIVNVLTALRKITPAAGKLIAVFGCGGNRDRQKRPLMAKAVESLADYAILTTDNPRFEDPEAIIAEAAGGFSSSRKYQTIPDRKSAIQTAIGNADKNDIIAVLGKGHETYQEIKGVRYPFYDVDVIRNYFDGQRD
ncbi:MAG: UDP-N-acetylmuramoyl-L-alanyl-D-glutamate--2,6-diaminopimelate ligase [Candidatus Neomarinimicrobiota bacterium]